MEQQNENNEIQTSDMMKQVAHVNAAAQGRVKGEETDETAALPKGAPQVEARAETPVESSEPSEEASPSSAGEVAAAPVAEPAAPAEPEEGPIRIAGREFKTQKEAFEWAERLEQERLIAEAHSAGIREALAAQSRATPEVPPEDDIESRFYTDPKKTLRDLHASARDEAVAVIRAENQRERAWSEFMNLYPDIRRADAEMLLQRHGDTIGKLPKEQGFRALASVVYKEYDEIANLRKPRQVLTDKKPSVSPSGAAPRGVTPQKTEEKSLSFSEQMARLRRR